MDEAESGRNGLRIFSDNPQLGHRLDRAQANNGAGLIPPADRYDDHDREVTDRLKGIRRKLGLTPLQT